MTYAARDASTEVSPNMSSVFPSNSSTPLSTFSAGSEIYAPRQKASCLYRIEFGAVRLHRMLSDGRRQVVDFYLAGETFGFEVSRTHSFFAEAMVATSTRTHCLADNTGTQPELLGLALHGMLRAQEHILVIGRQTAMERVAGFLLDMSDRQGGLKHFDLPMSRLDIADYLGLTIETVSRVFAKLRASGLIKLRSIRCVEIIEKTALRGLCA
ncbi:cyclic nucleotide-binding domain-containing protein [Neorhizobium lilium]|uniref:Cyclic nucleotide-binding domain-containing protein n=1 Tax=Neorhizobium lilium TaxID=2503024 RepID=A0A3S3T0W7_9HYPH|nr:helix-turn-helix domain-containing protein [Neorhizobium lilium]RWX79385.1 cyclic nucleotide-binding domain-containing protein [Neorhizobium lilium]